VPADWQLQRIFDGLENKPACLFSAGPGPGPTCGTQCFGPELDYSKLGLTQLVSVGFGEASSLNGPLLTLLSERQGGVYLQNSNAPGTDLKNYFVKAFGSISGESVMIDPEGTIAAIDPATPAVTYNSCGDGSLTFSAVWDKAIDPADLRLLVTSPTGDLVRGGPRVESSSERLWSHVRVDMPFRSAASGLWRAELVRPHQSFVNGFSPRAFSVAGEGVDLVRRQIHRLCPDGCKRVLQYENGFGGDSIYERALKLELDAGLIGVVERADGPEKFAELLRGGDWDLVVSAQGGDDRALPSDPMLERHLCSGRRAIVSDARPKSSARLLRCAGALHAGDFDSKVIGRSQSLNIDREIALRDPGNIKETWSLVPIAPSRALAFGDPDNRAVIVGRTKEGLEQKWFINILGRGLSKVVPVSFKSRWTTNDRILVGARIPPSYMRAGAYDRVDARVEVEYPLIGLGRLAAERKADAIRHRGETIDGAAALLARGGIPTAKIVIPLNDDGVDGDQVAGNYYWTGSLDRIPLVDGHYKLRYIFDLTAGGCTTRREANQSLVVAPGVDRDKTRIEPIPRRDLVPQRPAGPQRTELLITPLDRFGNLLGPERQSVLTCQPEELCRVDDKTVQDRGNGSYSFTLETQPGVASVRLRGFGGEFIVPVSCPDCGTLQGLKLSDNRTKEHGKFTGTVRLSSPAPQNEIGGAVVFLASSDARLVEMPDMIRVPAGRIEATFEASVMHVLEKHPKRVRISATYGAEKIDAPIGVFIEDHRSKARTTFKPSPAVYPHNHPPR
jgi:hypothetical protein